MYKMYCCVYVYMIIYMYTALNTATIGSRSVQDMDSFARGWKDLHALWEQESGRISAVYETSLQGVDHSFSTQSQVWVLG